MRTLNDRFNEEMKRPEFREAYQRAEQEYYLALKITEIRKEKGLTQTQLAKLMGISQQAVSKIEKGTADNFSVSTLRKFADAMGVELIIDIRPRNPDQA